jgi:small-conductance mechanosensitive channel
LLRANNGIESVVPNELLLTQRVENLSLENSRMLLTCHFWVGLDADPLQVQSLLNQAALTAPRVLAEPAPAAWLSEVTPQGLHFSLNFWMDDPSSGQSPVRSGVNLAVLGALRGAGIALGQAPHEVVMRS